MALKTELKNSAQMSRELLEVKIIQKLNSTSFYNFLYIFKAERKS
jgi:hypothetical protein